MTTNIEPLYCGYKVKYQAPGYLFVGYITSANNSKGEWYFTNGPAGFIVKDRNHITVLEAKKRKRNETFQMARNQKRYAINALTSNIDKVLPGENIVEPSYATPTGLVDHFANCKELIKTGSAKEVAQLIQANILSLAKDVVLNLNLNETVDNAAWSISRGVRVIVEPWAYELHRELRRLSLIPVMIVKCDGENTHRLSEV
ncbi:hypothetical protein LCS82_07620 [Vibrio harveyi]|uniref:hypothetical protein n=1 Tax=Vibrio harveyi TaxID=669 RepID=UPI003BB80EA8